MYEETLDFPCQHATLQYHLYTKKNHIQVKSQKKKMIYRFEMAAKLPIFTLRKFKTTFPEKFSNEIWLMKENYEYIYIAEIKSRIFYSCGILGAKQIFPQPPQKAHLC